MSKNNKSTTISIDTNTAVAHIAYAFSEAAAIYPITPSSSMGEHCEQWSYEGKKNIFDKTVKVVEMQSEAGASGTVHGLLSGGVLTSTFTASQGLLLMIPNMHKIAGELLPAVFHVAARSIAAQSLSIFGDHSDVMSVRNTGFALLSSNSVQEATHFAIIAHLASIESKIPFVHFFDGFRTSSEIQKINLPTIDFLKTLLPKKYVDDFKKDRLNPENPICKVGAQNPDIYFQGRETVNIYYKNLKDILKNKFDLINKKFKTNYSMYEYYGSKKPTKIIVSMGSSCETIEETIDYLNSKKDQKIGLIKVRVYRPFYQDEFLKVLPKSVKKIAVLDRTKEPGSVGEPLYLDVVATIQKRNIDIIGGRYGLSSKEFTPTMVKTIYDHLDNKKLKHGFTIGINDDVTKTSLRLSSHIDINDKNIYSCKFYGIGSDGTVGANKNTIKIIGDNTKLNVQGYFEYDSKKSGGTTISHLRFGKSKIKSQYNVESCDFVALHKHSYIGQYDILKGLKKGGIFLLNTPYSKETVFQSLTKSMQKYILENNIKFYVIDANQISHNLGLKNRINIIMQTAFFKLTNILNFNKAKKLIEDSIIKTYSKKGKKVVDMNIKAVSKTIENLHKANIPKSLSDLKLYQKEFKLNTSNQFLKDVVEKVMKRRGDEISVSCVSCNGSVPTGTSKFEKRKIATEIPAWVPEKCIQCGMCSFVCPHSAIRIKQIHKNCLGKAPDNFKVIDSKTKNNSDLKYRVQVSPLDCTGCNLCANVCPTKALVMSPVDERISDGEVENWNYFEKLEEDILDGVLENTIKGTQFKQALFEFSGACSGCGETPYIKLLTQMFGDRMIIANATGCSSIYGGYYPTTPYTTNKDGHGPAWANSLFEDNAEYGYGIGLATEINRLTLKSDLNKLKFSKISAKLKTLIQMRLNSWDENGAKAKNDSKKIKDLLKLELQKTKDKHTKTLLKSCLELSDQLVKQSTWIIGGDGWAYDIGYGGLDHVLAQGKNVNVLVLDTEVYSNTGGQSSKSSPLGSVAKFTYGGKRTHKKDLAHMMMSYKNIYVATVNLGANMMQLIKAFAEAESYDGPSIIIAYSPCIAHGIDMSKVTEIQKLATKSGYWPLFRYNPSNFDKEGQKVFTLDSNYKPLVKLEEYLLCQNRFKQLQKRDPKIFTSLVKEETKYIEHKLTLLKTKNDTQNV